MNGLKVSALNVLLILIAAGWLPSCEVFDNKAPEDNNFQQIYTIDDGDASLYPLDITELENGEGYLVLSALSDSLATIFPRVHLLKLSANGNSEWQLAVSSTYFGPVKNIVSLNGEYYVFCMKDNQQTCALRVNLNAQSVDEFTDFDVQLPLHVSVFEDKDVLITAYDRFGNETNIVKLNQNLQHQWTKSFSVGTDEDIMEVNVFNFVKQEKNYPFFSQLVEKDGNQYFAVNCFSNYTLSMHYLSREDGAIEGKINGYQLTGFVSAVQQVTDTTLFLGYAHTGKFYIPAMKSPETGTFVNIENLGGVYYPEIMSEKAVDALVYPEEAEPEKLVLGINNGNGNPELFLFNSPEFNLSQTIAVDQHYPAEIRKIKKTTDGGIVVLMQVYYANYLPRISLVKVPEEVVH